MTHSALPRVDLVVMLAGGLKPSPLAAAAGCSVLDLSADGERSILEHWVDHLARAFADRSADPVPVRILHGSALAPSAIPADRVPGCLRLSVERETKEFRGPAGVVKDAADELPPEATVLVIEAARWFGGDLSEVIRAHQDPGAGGEPTAVTVVSDRRSAPAGIVLLERSTLDPISQLGFMDLKEQWLGRLREMGRVVRVLRLSDAPCVLLRDRRAFLEAAREAVGTVAHTAEAARPLFSAQDLGRFAAVSSDCSVEPNTSIVDSVIMKGAVIGAGAIVARSLVCPGGRVEPNEVVVDQVRATRRGQSPEAAVADGSREDAARRHRRGERSG